MINLDYYYRTDIYEINNILKKGLIFDYYKTEREYGKAVYLTDKSTINLNNKNIVLNVHMKHLDNILIVSNFEELKTNYLNKIITTALSNINTASAPNIINSIILSVGDQIALSNQTNILENGIYIFTGTGLPLERIVDVNGYINQYGRTIRLGLKYIQKYMLLNNYNGLKINNENLLVLYNTNNIKNIKVYDKK